METKKNQPDNGIVGKLLNNVAGVFSKKGKADAGRMVANKVEAGQGQQAFDYRMFLDGFVMAISSNVRELVRDRKLYPGRELVIYINDESICQKAKDNCLDEAVNDKMEEVHGVRFRQVIIEQGVVPERYRSMHVRNYGYVSFTIRSNEQVKAEKKVAVPTLKMNNDDSACKVRGDELKLDGEDGTVWNIGWGTDWVVNGIPRKNHIALEYKNPEEHEKTEEHEKKVYPVSRAHAHIKRVQNSYLLFVDVRGTRQVGKHTKIVRNGKEIPLNNVNTGVALEDGDIIRLNLEFLKFNKN